MMILPRDEIFILDDVAVRAVNNTRPLLQHIDYTKVKCVMETFSLTAAKVKGEKTEN